MGVDTFNAAARASVFKYKSEWEDFMRRLGRWADIENSYATMDDDYIESVWWVMSRLHQKDLVYRGFRSSPYCPRCATPLSNFEVNQNYKDNVSDPSVYVKFQVEGDEKTSLLAWTTTPWTLPANAALAVKADADYVTVAMTHDGDGWVKGERLILAKGRIGELDLRKAEYRIVETRQGSELVGTKYRPLYPRLVEQRLLSDIEREKVHKVYRDDSVSLEDGTGILHVAPRYGETDLELGLREDLPLIESVDGNGLMSAYLKDIEDPFLATIAGMFFKKADNHIIEDLAKQHRIFAAETFEHTYPFCWRCETPLMYFALPSWYIKVSELRGQLVGNNDQINWIPEHIKVGRFGKWLADARDWNFSRNRFWGAPLPIWVNDHNSEDIIVVGSLDELRKLSGHTGEFDLHRPGIDEVVIKRDAKTYRRTEEVFDCWFESGSMPYAQDHWMGGQSGEELAPHFPAQFIAEGVDQTRGWFYTLHVLATALVDKPAFENVVVNGLVLAADGKKLSKRLRNYPDPSEIFATSGADSLRFFLMSSPVVGGEDVRFSAQAVSEVNRNVFTRLWNVHSFFSTYAEIDKWQPEKELREPKSDNVLDQWLLARLNQVIAEMTEQADNYRIASAVRPLRDFIDDLSNWYVRRSRRRFWKSEDDGDKASAYATLHYAMVRTSQLLAPWSPFISDKLWRELTVGMDVPASVHLSDWPEAGEVNSLVVSDMNNVRQIVNEGLAARAKAGIKVRQPLNAITVTGNVTLSPESREIVADELNLKSVNMTVKDLEDGVKYGP
ncbi:MAG TPA: isoleucine--tRNA ligase, partial [Candidatus Saccharimonadia bacterium]